MKTFKQFNEAKATMCGRCGTVHVAPKDGGTCPGPRKEETQIDEISSATKSSYTKAASKDLDSKLTRFGKHGSSTLRKSIEKRSNGIQRANKEGLDEANAPGSVKHKGKTYYPTGKTGKDIKTGHPSHEYSTDLDGDDHRVWYNAKTKKVTAESVELDEAMSKVVRDKMQQLAGGTMPKGAEFRALKKKAEDQVKAEREGKSTAKKAEPVVKKAQTGSGKGDDDRHIISQLRKAQDVGGNFDIGFHRDTGRLTTQEIDTLLKAHDKLKPEGKRQLRVMIRDVKSAKKVAASLKGKV